MVMQAPIGSRSWWRRQPAVAWTVGLTVAAVAAVAVAGTVDRDALGAAMGAISRSPAAAVGVLVAFGAAFAVRAAVWARLLPGLSMGQAVAAVHLALAGNHVLPLRLGEPLRVVSAVRRSGVSVEGATASTVVLRTADVLALAVVGMVAAPGVVQRLVGHWAWIVVAAAAAGVVAGLWWLRSIGARRAGEVRFPDPLVVVGTLVAWLLEAVVVWQSAHWAGISLSPSGALLVTSVSVVAQLAAVAPGGFGTYEAAGAAAYAALGHDPAAGLAAALTAHALKTAYSLGAGAVALVAPSPGFLGRLRLAGAAPRRCGPAGPGPVVLVLPALDEEATVAHVVARAPKQVADRPVHVVVVDDGSTDATAARAEAAGATVIRLPSNRGLGAAVRRGLAEAVRHGAAAVAFCDADGEYAPEELEAMVMPIMSGEAHYVVGSRFASGTARMRPHRRVGNLVLTRLLAAVARHPFTDGQSGFRALSGEAAAAAEIVHDYNYAQVLTLDLLGKGFRYAEVPISYGFRREGTSFVRLGTYLRRVVPAVHRELNDVVPAGASVRQELLLG